MSYEYSNIELEKLLINILCLNTNNLEYAINNILADDFTNDICRQTFYIICDQYKQFNSICSSIEIKNKLQSKYENKEIVEAFIDSIFNLKYNNDTNIQSIISLIKEKSKARKIVKLIQQLGHSVNNGEIQKCDELLNKYLQYDDSSKQFTEVDATDHIQSTLMNIIKERENPSQFDGIKTNFECIDNIVQGLKKSEFLCFVAKAGGGKTTVMNNVVASNLLQGKKILYFIIESPVKQYEINLSAYLANINAKEMHENTVSNEDLMKVDEIWRKIKQKGGEIIFIDAPQNLTSVALQMEIRRTKRKFKGNIDLVVIDYMQIMENGSSNPYDWSAIVNISKQLKAIARAENIPLISALQEVKKQDDGKKKESEHSQADIAYAKGVADNLDMCIKIHQSDMDKLSNRMSFFFLKARRAAFISNQGFSVRCNLAQQIIDIDSERKLKKQLGYIQ